MRAICQADHRHNNWWTSSCYFLPSRSRYFALKRLRKPLNSSRPAPTEFAARRVGHSAPHKTSFGRLVERGSNLIWTRIFQNSNVVLSVPTPECRLIPLKQATTVPTQFINTEQVTVAVALQICIHEVRGLNLGVDSLSWLRVIAVVLSPSRRLLGQWQNWLLPNT
jgi:hypothetical protein